MLLRIDPELSIVWRTPAEVQIDAPIAVATVPLEDDWAVRVFELLRVGVTPERLRALMCQAEDPTVDDRLGRLLARVERALSQRSSRFTASPTVSFVGDQRCNELLSERLSELGVTTSATTDASQLTVITGHFVVRPDLYQPLMVSDRPHLAVIFEDRQVRISQQVLPGRTACLFCWEQQHRARDGAWPTLAAQLLRRRALSAEGPLGMSAAAELATRLDDIASARPFANDVLTIRPGERLSEQLLPNPQCACCSLPRNVTEIARPASPNEPSSPEVIDALA